MSEPVARLPGQAPPQPPAAPAAGATTRARTSTAPTREMRSPTHTVVLADHAGLSGAHTSLGRWVVHRAWGHTSTLSRMPGLYSGSRYTVKRYNGVRGN